MIALPLALSLSNSVTEVGAVAAFAALVGIAILSLLVFSQGREIKRLREWAGRAPERAAEMEQRVSADAAARVQRAAVPSASAGRVVPRKTPLVSAPVSTAVNATVAAAGLRGEAASTPPTPGAAATPPENGIGAVDSAPSVESAHGGGLEDAGAEQARPAPATAAARAAGAAARAPLPPSPAAPAPPGGASSPAPRSPDPSSSEPTSSVPVAQEVSVPAAQTPESAPAGQSREPAGQSHEPAPRPPAPVAAARRTPSRSVAASGSVAAPASDVPVPSPPSSRVRATGSAGKGGAARTALPSRATGATDTSGPKYFKPERRSQGRAAALIAVGVIAGVVVLVLAVSVLKGGGGGSSATTAASRSATGKARSSTSHRSVAATPATPATPPGETSVVVLNGTSTAGLAHHLAGDLQQGGYTRAAALAGVPPGTHATTAVQYTHGHRADAQAVAKAINVTQVQAIEPSTASLAGSATVVVLAGADQAAQLGGGGAQSKGEPGVGATGAGGESAAGSG